MQYLIWNNEPQIEGIKADTPVSPPRLTVERINNHIYFYADVDTDRTLDLIRQIREIDDWLCNERRSRWVDDSVAPTPIWLHIQSPGGSLFAGFSVADQLATVQTPIYSLVEGYCASAATLISTACAKRFILPNAFMLIHQLSSIAWGKYEELKDEMNLLDMAMEKVVDFYAGHTRIPKDEVRELLKRDSWFSANQCVERGLVDEILTK